MPILTVKTDKKNINIEKGAAIIDVCETEETSILFGCRDGACGACMIRVLENPENLSPMEEHERDFLETMAAREDERLACQCKVLGNVTVEVSE
ncbi:2Fe-2S iron-sulfur cluster-binding protein [Fluviispira multicolorata]|uniref:2Fe-2S iron-sulfur cluster binding domain-containing protein n=1 Tax=Fluviispira multicolorata TaxID=2654512 RepID=A0A833JHD0_9BACT|nr:2Fe-2S iron-sulfur cluster-binding protein [Fluviispira multicolorata]KAB8033332.1 2Fe-2S iron-sulfur cluster binding domain-containing protein [Fluviispira multicolorata]